LPRIEEERVPAGKERLPADKATARGTEVILLAEDEKGVRELAREYLQTSGYTVLMAEDGRSAIELASMHAGPIHLLMTDVVMPGIGGPEVAQRIKALRPEIKVLYMSGYTDQAIMHQGVLQDGAVLLQKPFTLATLASKLREMLAGETVIQ
jgi:CheY-like chemotaxis protein